MAEHTLTPDQIAMINATVDRVHRERADAGIMAARYDAACERVCDLHDEVIRQRFRIEALEDQLRDRTRERDSLLALLSHVRTTLNRWHAGTGGHAGNCVMAVAELRQLLNPEPTEEPADA